MVSIRLVEVCKYGIVKFVNTIKQSKSEKKTSKYLLFMTNQSKSYPPSLCFALSASLIRLPFVTQ